MQLALPALLVLYAVVDTLLIARSLPRQMFGDEWRYVYYAENLVHGFFSPTPSLFIWNGPGCDRAGVSFYAYERIYSALEISLDEYLLARNGLIDQDLIAFDGTRFQVLSLPAAPVGRSQRPLATQDDLDQSDPATQRQIIRGSLDQDR
jgi:hypothetical protein